MWVKYKNMGSINEIVNFLPKGVSLRKGKGHIQIRQGNVTTIVQPNDWVVNVNGIIINHRGEIV